MKELMARSDQPAVRDTAIWFGLILTFGALGIATWGTWWAVPVFAVYGMLYGGLPDPPRCGARLRRGIHIPPLGGALVLGAFLLVAWHATASAGGHNRPPTSTFTRC